MTTNDFVLSEIHELLALQRVLMEARYCEIPTDTAISASPIVADMHRKVLDAIIAANLPAGLSPANIKKWLVMDESRREWEIALRRASQYYAWTRISEEEKRSFVLCLFSPFKVSEGSLSKFLLRADEMASQ